MGVAHDMHRALAANAVDLGRDGLGPLREAARERSVVVVAGLNEIDRSASSTLYNTTMIAMAAARGTRTRRMGRHL